MQHQSPIKTANQLFRDKNYAGAIPLYLQAMRENPEPAHTFAPSAVLARKRYRAERRDQKPAVLVCGWELSHNAAGRVHTLVQLYEIFADVQIIGTHFPNWGRELWPPLRGTKLPVHSFVVQDQSKFIAQALELVQAHPCDVLHLSRPRLPNILFGILYKLVWDAAVLMDIDDEEPAFVQTQASLSLSELLQKHGKLPEFKDIAGPEWTRQALGMADAFDGITVSNPVLQERYGGEIVSHGGDSSLDESFFAAEVPRLRKAVADAQSGARVAQVKLLLLLLSRLPAPASLQLLAPFRSSEKFEEPKSAVETSAAPSMGADTPRSNAAGVLSHEVVVCVHNAPQEVRKCIDSLLRHADGISSVVVVDDHSDAETVELLKEYAGQHQPWIRLYRTPERYGYTRAANFGLSYTDADIVTLLNSDTIVTPGWAGRLTAHFERFPALGILGPLSNAASYQSVPGIVGTKTQTAINELPAGIGPDQVAAHCSAHFGVDDMPYVPLVHGFCFTISRACLDKVGLFDEKRFPLGYGEENDYCLRAQDEGFALGVALDTFIFHTKSKSYTEDERVGLMKDGWNTLVATYGDRRITGAIEVMQNHPALRRARESTARCFYSGQTDAAALPVGMPRGELLGRGRDVGVMAFYLPQFHPTPENDRNWGKGFTEWTNVTRARPRFAGHYQPRLPTELGFYDLRVPQVMAQQAELAAEHGVVGFCFYYYRFGRKRMLDLPLHSYRENIEVSLPYCYCWANEPWTRAWDGRTSEVLFDQPYDKETLDGLIADLVHAIADDRYIRIGGRPVFIIYQAAKVPNPGDFAARLRQEVHRLTREDLFLGTVYSPDLQTQLMDVLDFAVQFPPHRFPRDRRRVVIPQQEMRPYEPQRDDYYESYEEVVAGALRSCELLERMFPGVCPDWDNSPRRQRNSHMLVGSSPQRFREWVRQAADIARKKYINGRLPLPLVFLNSWNEWAEGATVEPSDRYGRAYLQALHAGVTMSDEA